jgi:hypothetical protein
MNAIRGAAIPPMFGGASAEVERWKIETEIKE